MSDVLKPGIHEPGTDELVEATGLSPFAIALAVARRAKDLNDGSITHHDGDVIFTGALIPTYPGEKATTTATREIGAGVVKIAIPEEPPLDQNTDITGSDNTAA